MARPARLRVYPVKWLDGVGVETAAVREGGTLADDREYALFDSDDEVVSGKRTPRVHDLSTAFDPSTGVFHVETPAGERRSFDLPADRRDSRSGRPARERPRAVSGALRGPRRVDGAKRDGRRRPRAASPRTWRRPAR